MDIEKKDSVVETKKPRKQPKKIAEKVKTGQKGIVTDCRMLNLRDRGCKTGKILGTIPAGAEISVDLDKSNETFFFVTTEMGVQGFCMKQYIKLI